MKQFFVFSILCLLSLRLWSSPMHIKTVREIVIDTDCAIDDMRAISLLLSCAEIRIKGILVSDGSLTPADGRKKVLALLREFGRDSVPVATGKVLKGVHPPWSGFNRQLSWGKGGIANPSSQSAVGLLREILAQDSDITLVCLGPLTNVADLVRADASAISKVHRLIWYNDSAAPLKGFNYECDKPAADLVLKSGIRVDVISNLQKKETRLDHSFNLSCSGSDTRLAEVLFQVHSQQAVLKRLAEGHLRLYDDLVAVYVTNPELFDMDVADGNAGVRYNRDYDAGPVKEVIEEMIKGKYIFAENVVFNGFPKERILYTYDVRQIMDSAIVRYGMEEWKANVMTDEFHGHLGVFSIIGAKMGIKARELLGAERDQAEVTSFAGAKPPFSCLNDGIQVSTGATLGMGTIHLAAGAVTRPAAIFSYKGRSVEISLKPEYLKQVNDDIKEGIVKFGLTDEGYWHLVRRNAIHYWLDWDRNEIFDIKEENRANP
ncbi:MAG: nucleoside hydrolase [Mangrovibacterium sp.]